MNKDRQFEIAIIGGGVVGALCAWYLCKAGHEVVLMTKGRIGDGATSASLGIACANPGEGMHRLASFAGMDAALEAYRTDQDSLGLLAKILQDQEENCDFAKKQQLVFAQDPGDAVILYQNYKALSNAGFNVEWVDRTAAGGKYSFPVEGAIFSETNSIQLDPLKLTHILLQEAQGMGLVIYENTLVEQIRQESEGVALRTDHFHVLRARKVVVATGVPPADYIENVMHWRCESLCTLPLPPVSGMVEDYFLTDYDGEWRMCMVEERLMVSRLGIPWPYWEKIRGLAAKRILRKILHFYPKAEGILSTGYHFAAHEYQTEDGLPLIGCVPDAQNIYTVSAYHSNGIGAGIIAGRLLCAWFRGENPPFGKLYRPQRVIPIPRESR